MNTGTLVLGVDAGPLNFLGGFSIGSAGSLKWKPDGDGRSIETWGKKKKIPAYHCEECGDIVFRMP